MSECEAFLATPAFHRLTGALVRGVVASTPARLLIRGEQGLGKTTNIEQSIQHVDAHFGLVLRGRSHPLRLAFYPLADAIWSIAESARHRYAAKKALLDAGKDVLKLIPVLGPFAPDLAGLLGGTPPLLPTAALQPLDVAFHIRHLLRSVSKSRPLLLVLDDLHDFDTSTLSALYCLLRDMPADCSVMISLDPTAASPDDVLYQEFEDQLVESFGFETVDLTAFSPEQVGLLAEMILGSDTSVETRSLIYRFTNGHPFFVAEVCRAIQDRSLATERLAEDACLPSTERLRRFVDRRLQHIESEQRSTLDLASVFGDAFPSIPIAACLGQDHIRVLKQLRVLESIHRLVRPGEQEYYHFTVPAIRERVYELLGRDVAREQHLLIAQTLSKLSPGADWDFEIGRHLLLAGHTDEGITAMRRAATSAMRTNHFGDAAERFRHIAVVYATTRSEDISARQQSMLETIRSLRQQMDIPSAVAYCRHLASEQHLSPLVEPQFAIEEMALAYYTDKFEECISRGQAILRDFIDVLSIADRMTVRLTLSAALYHLGHWAEARHHYRACFREKGMMREPLLLAQALKRANMFYFPELALPKLQSLDDHSELRGHPDLHCEVLTNIGMNYLLFSDTDRATNFFRRAIDGFGSLGSHKQTYPMNGLALADLIAGRFTQARKAFASLVTDFTEGFEKDCARSNEAVCNLLEGDHDAASHSLDEIWQRLSTGCSPILFETIGQNLGLALEANGRVDESVDIIMRTSPKREYSGASFDRGRRHRLVARIGGKGTHEFLAATDADYQRLAISDRKDAALFRNTDYQIADLWFFE